MGSTAIMLSSDSNNNAISNNTIEYAIFGVLIEGACSHNVIIYNNLKSWLAYGVCVRNYIFSSPDDNDIIENKIEGAFYGICLVHSSHDTISNNNIVNNVNGIYLENSGREIISGNYFADNFQGISLINHSCFNKIIYNTFKDVTQNASFSNCFYNKWSRNFWGEPKSAPFTISGYLWNGKLLHIPWFNFDWHPAQEPYDI
jgi:parallel beta-helix repeat protein